MTWTRKFLDVIEESPMKYGISIAMIRVTKSTFARMQTESCEGAHWNFEDGVIKLNDVVVEVWPDA